jgi:D-alanyl-D-alanine carboxypeptidase
MLLAHTNGVPNYFEIPAFQVAFLEAPGKIWDPMELLSYIANTENHFPPGSEYRYTDTSFLLAGLVAERVTGVPIGMALRQWVFEPAGLENSFGPYENLGQPETMRAYVPISFFEGLDLDLDLDLPVDEPDVDTTDWLNSEGDGHASVQSIPADLNTFIRTLIDTDTLVSEELRAEMMTESFSGVSGYGLGLQIFDDGSIFGHGGKGLGLHSLMRYSPSENLSLAIVVNASFGIYDELYSEFIHQLNLVLAGRE